MKHWAEGWTKEDWERWHAKFPDEPEGCIACGRSAGCCDKYPNCPGNLEWKPLTVNEQLP